MPSGERIPTENQGGVPSRIRRLAPFLILLVVGVALGGIMITFLLPSGVLKPEALRAQALVQIKYQEMIDAALREAPPEITSYREKEECWKEGKRFCVYGWYAEWVSGGYLLSYTLASEEEDRRGILRGWWWEVEPQNEIVRPVWESAALRKKYGLHETDPSPQQTDRPLVAPLMKIP